MTLLVFSRKMKKNNNVFRRGAARYEYFGFRVLARDGFIPGKTRRSYEII